MTGFLNKLWGDHWQPMNFIHGYGLSSAPRMKFVCCLFLLLLTATCLLSTANAQSRKQLENRRHALMEEIKATNDLLKDTRANQKTTINQYYTLQKQIEKRQQLITTLQEEVQLSNSSIDRAKEVVFSLSEDVEQLKSEYATMLQHAYRMKLTNNKFLFLISSESVNEAFRRWNYLKQYDSYRQNQAELIQLTQSTLSQKAAQLIERKSKKEQLLVSETSQRNILMSELTASDKLLSQLRNDEMRLEGELSQKEKAHQKLNSTIQKLIQAEIKRRESARIAAAEKIETTPKKSETVAPKPPPAPAANTRLSSNFSSNRGRLPWPVDNGVIIGRHGNQAHPTLRNVRIQNNGIDIQTEKNSTVKAVFEGEVLAVQFIPGNNYMVMVLHGDYYTVYSNLDQVDVRRTDKVAGGQQLGTVALDASSGEYEVHFEVWKNSANQNPSQWIRKR